MQPETKNLNGGLHGCAEFAESAGSGLHDPKRPTPKPINT